VSRSFGQGCFPIRYTSPTLGDPIKSAQGAGLWQIGLAYRRLHADQFYIGHDYRPESVPGGLQSSVNINTVELGLSYAPTRRFAVSLGVPISTGTHAGAEDDKALHVVSATGVGDVSVVGTMWVLDPPFHAKGNIAVGLGLKAPTGQNAKSGDWHTATGSVQRAVDPSVQLGDGGWGMILRTEAFRQIYRRTAVYAAGAYLANPREHSNATFTTAYGVVAPIGVADEYSAHAGITVDASRRRGLSLSLGGRIDGIPVRDVIGGGDESFRRPGYAVYVEPGMALRLSGSPVSPAASMFTLGVPIRVDQNRMASLLEVAHGRHGGGNFAPFLIFAGYAKRW
jgi:hypothetical protein